MFFLSIKQLLSRMQQTILTFIGLLLGTAGYIILSGVMLGFQEYFVDILINNDAHIKITPRDDLITPESFEGVFFSDALIRWKTPPSGITDNSRLSNVQGWLERARKDDRIAAVSPRLQRQVIFKSGSVTLPGTLTGVNPRDEMGVTTISENVVEGRFENIAEGQSIILIGEGLMKRLGARPGSTIQVINSGGDVVPVKIKGVIRTGIGQIDRTIAYGSLNSVRKITNSSGEVTSIALKLYDVSYAAEIATSLAQYSPDKVESWDQANANILSMFSTQDVMRNAITFTIVLVVAFGIYNILNMVVNQKKKEVAILRSIGYTPRDITMLFLTQGLILGVLGALAGLLIGGFAVYMISLIEIDRGQFDQPRKMLVSWNYMIYVNAFLLTLISSVIASIIPARLAGRFSPIKIIREAGG